jgi:phospholipase/carboxylesterase/glyoxalase family protein
MSNDPHANQPIRTAGASLDRANSAVVMVHGRGASADGILGLADEFAQPDLAYLAPQAAGHAWYPYSFLAPLPRNEPWLSSALRFVGRVLEEVAAHGIPPERTVLCGFSQGACLASEYAARNPQRYGGVVAFSGGLIGNEQLQAVDPPADKVLDYEGDLGGTPVFLGCSDEDAHIPLVRVEHSAEALEKLGADVTMRIYPGMGHTVNEDEIAFARGLLARLQRAA